MLIAIGQRYWLVVELAHSWLKQNTNQSELLINNYIHQCLFSLKIISQKLNLKSIIWFFNIVNKESLFFRNHKELMIYILPKLQIIKYRILFVKL